MTIKARTRSDPVATRALLLARHPSFRPHAAAAALVTHAEGNRDNLRRALQRIQSRRPDRSIVADRAVVSLRLALATLDAPPNEVRATFGGERVA